MMKILTNFARLNRGVCCEVKGTNLIKRRTFLSHAYNCKEVWDHRHNDPLLKNARLEELYQELDQRYQRTQQMSAVDVDIFANAMKNDTYIDELLDLAHKLRLSADTCNTLGSTPHAIIRILNDFNQTDLLLNVLDDRLNYGVFLDDYTANLLMDKFWKKKDFLSGTRVASQMMLQEDFEHPLTRSFSLLHCYNYLLKPTEWPKVPEPEEPEEEVKIRVKFIRNPYDDEHFDLKDPKKIVGKTLHMITKNDTDELAKSFQILGLALYEKPEKASKIVEDCANKNTKICREIINILPDDNEIKNSCQKLQQQSLDVQNLLEDRVKTAVQSIIEKDIARQCDNYQKWIEDRKIAMDEQMQRLNTDKRLQNIENLMKELREKEVKLWFFENEEKIELQIEDKQIKEQETVMKKKTTETEEYIPPEITVTYKS